MVMDNDRKGFRRRSKANCPKATRGWFTFSETEVWLILSENDG